MLLSALLKTIEFPMFLLFLDERVKYSLLAPQATKILFVGRNFFSRLIAELILWYKSRVGMTVLCFHGLPPIFPNGANVKIFIQNRLLFERTDLKNHAFSVQIKCYIQILILKLCHRSCYQYIVQTPSMASLIKLRFGNRTNVIVCPFVPTHDWTECVKTEQAPQKYDFAYVASGDAHKNHDALVDAWIILAKSGVKPTLVFTLDEDRFRSLWARLSHKITSYDLHILNLGHQTRNQVYSLYSSVSALIHASKSESFGLPLFEASELGIPILAPELDYVRDIVKPVQTFDVNSAVSIARAVERFLDLDAEPSGFMAPRDFLELVTK